MTGTVNHNSSASWLEANWDKFVDEGIDDANGRLITVRLRFAGRANP